MAYLDAVLAGIITLFAIFRKVPLRGLKSVARKSRDG
jgi:hypothetical protein